MTKISDNSYKLEGSGSSVSDAINSLSDKKNNLTRKFASAQVSSNFSADRTVFEGDYVLKDQSNGPDLRTFTVKGKSADELTRNAQKYLDQADATLDQYSMSVTQSEFYTLSDEQMTALRPSPPTAGYEPGRDSLSSKLSIQ